MKILGFSIAKEGWAWLLGCVALGAFFVPVSVGIASTLIVAGVLLALFFRVPARVSPQAKDLILSPADGKVIGVDQIEEPNFLRAPCRRVSIFLSLFDVHMNYAPADGVIDWLSYQKGQFHMAFAPKASDTNENQRIGITTPAGKILVRQIAGAIARRIVLFKKAQEKVAQGECIGMIRFGSRVEIYLPMASAIQVQVGDRVCGGLTVLARVAGI